MMKKIGKMLALAVVTTSLVGTASAQANSVNYGCSKNGRNIAATAYYTAVGSTQWNVSSINYSYSNSGGGKTNTTFAVYNGTNATAWTWATPDDRKNQGYSKSVVVNISRGAYARAYQKTYFDMFGNDPSCSQAGTF